MTYDEKQAAAVLTVCAICRRAYYMTTPRLVCAVCGPSWKATQG